MCLSATAAWAVGTPAGTALIQDGSGHNVNSGGSQTTWTVALPPGAACTKDTASNNYVVSSYIVDSANNPDPALLTFQPTGQPVSAGTGTAFNLFDTTNHAYSNVATSPVTGQVVGIGAFNFNRFSLNSKPRTFALPATNYHIGIACVKPDGTVDNFWDTQITFTANGSDPNGEVWQTNPNPQIPESALAIALPVTAAVLLAGGGYVMFRRRRHDAPVAV